MKKIVSLFGLGLLLTLGTGCNKEFLEKQPSNDLAAENFYKDEADAQRALNGAYHGLQKSGCYRLRMWTLDIMAGNSIVGAGGASDGLETQQLANFSTTTANPGVADIWSTHYQTILAVNVVLNRVPAINMDATKRDIILGEAHFIRALSYFNLVRLFGKVPLILTPQTTRESLNVARNPVADVYRQIEQDLTSAELVLPETAAIAGHATKGAAKGLLAKVYLTQNKWADAATKAQEVTGLGKYSLGSFSGNFDPNAENGSESLFEIQYAYDPNNNGFGGDAVCNLRSEFMAPRSSNITSGGGFGWNQPTAEFVGQFEAGDRRKALTVFSNGDQLGGYTYSSNSSITGFNTRKFIVPLSAGLQTGFANDPLNTVVLRYADVLLMQAEALNEQGRTTDARGPLNLVRARAGLLPVNTSSQTTMRDAIMKERRIELAFENGERWFDLIRTKDNSGTIRALSFLRALGSPNDQYGVGRGNISEKYLLLPVPQNERDNNSVIDQNPGY
ncbi:RagB/SusD family nutrient uptake outer membrane protein [Hymenobacter sp. M29]|uniref:RagB/SusD family nutrient uptake outer membrane protein n=1 Tax=Hymenobacter mellowenesis TaxID=3063995 RepID=A0ABT9AF95_9BACT|nr:RagB/SusD family nutrient uptake outer membrane protein [Hymenobacter sp. M29]MDO7848535.1 RagB/SusD family nutrient uptake outer membrane protein [Hymenobacter sp. M29]